MQGLFSKISAVVVQARELGQSRQMALYHVHRFSKVALTGHAVQRVKIMSTRDINRRRVQVNSFYAYYFMLLHVSFILVLVVFR